MQLIGGANYTVSCVKGLPDLFVAKVHYPIAVLHARHRVDLLNCCVTLTRLMPTWYMSKCMSASADTLIHPYMFVRSPSQSRCSSSRCGRPSLPTV